MIELELPYPPSVNHYYRHVGPKMLISREGRKYREQVIAAMRGHKQLHGKLALKLEAYPPDNRRRDLDNLFKALLDALQHGGAYGDDSQIKRISAKMQEAMPPAGMIVIKLAEISAQGQLL